MEDKVTVNRDKTKWMDGSYWSTGRNDGVMEQGVEDYFKNRGFVWHRWWGGGV